MDGAIGGSIVSQSGRCPLDTAAGASLQLSHRHAALVIVDIDADGNASDSQTIEVGGSFPLPCATWSADGQRVAFGVSMTSWIHPERSVAGSEVWVVRVANAEIDVVSDTFATDLAWSPEGSDLAIASHDAG